MEWFPISSCSGHRFIRSLHYDLSWVAHSFIEFCKSLYHDEAVTHEEVLVIREMKIKTIKRCHLTTVKTSTIDIEGGGRTGKEEEGVSTGEDVENWNRWALLVERARAQLLWKTIRGVPKN